MTLPPRIIDGGAGDWEQRIIRSAARDAPSPEFRRGLARELGIAVGVAGITGTTATAAQIVSGALWLKWMGVGMAIGLVTVGAVSYATHGGRLEQPAPVVASPAHTATPKTVEVAVSASTFTPAAPAVPFAVSRAIAAPAPSAPASSAPASSAPASAVEAPAVKPSLVAAGLAAELASIEAVREALAAKNGSEALRALGEYERAYAGGTFALEARVLRIEACALLGDRAELKRLAERFLAEQPRSPYARRVRSLLNPAEGTAQ